VNNKETKNLIKKARKLAKPFCVTDDHPHSAAARSFVLAQADVLMLIGARLNWLLGHGRSPQWSATAKFVQLDIAPTEMDSNRAIAAPVVGDIASSVSALLATLKPGQIRPRAAWLEDRCVVSNL
jgi:oxalyl-CoA decarboxylase